MRIANAPNAIRRITNHPASLGGVSVSASTASVDKRLELVPPNSAPVMSVTVAAAPAIETQSDAEKQKRCPLPRGCGETKVLAEFSVNRSRRDGRCTYCSTCTTRMSQAYRDHF